MKVGKGDNVVAFCVDRLSPVVTVLLVVYSGSVVITGIAPNVSARPRKPGKRETSYFVVWCNFPEFDVCLDNNGASHP